MCGLFDMDNCSAQIDGSRIPRDGTWAVSARSARTVPVPDPSALLQAVTFAP